MVAHFIVMCVLLCLGAGTRVLGLLEADELPDEQLAKQYGALVQCIIDDPTIL